MHKHFLVQSFQSHAKGVGVDDIAQWNLTGAKALYELDPDNVFYTECLGGAHCLAGENWDGVRYYRKARAMGSKRETSSLILAQLQCPGMPLEHYHILNLGDNNQLTCVHKRDLGSITIDLATGDVINSGTGGLDMIVFEAPDDPDDPEAFGALLKQLNSVEGK